MEVTKHSGKIESYDVEKIHKVVEWATDGINNVSLSDIEMNMNLSLRDKIGTDEIHQILIKSASDLISEAYPNYQYVAARLLNMSLRKAVWKDFSQEPCLYNHICLLIDSGVYDHEMMDNWTPEEVEILGKHIKHDRDNLFTYSGLQQLIDKYLIKNRTTNTIYETPQLAYMAIAMCLFNKSDNKIKQAKEAYDSYSTFKVNLPTPIMAGARSTIKQFASCVLVDIDDDLDGIFASLHAVGKYTARRAGIGLNAGRIRPINSPVRGGEVIHTGLIPYLKIFE